MALTSRWYGFRLPGNPVTVSIKKRECIVPVYIVYIAYEYGTRIYGTGSELPVLPFIPIPYPYRFCHAEFAEVAKTRFGDQMGTKSITTTFHFFIPSL